jgi:hypothetical protein
MVLWYIEIIMDAVRKCALAVLNAQKARNPIILSGKYNVVQRSLILTHTLI